MACLVVNSSRFEMEDFLMYVLDSESEEKKWLIMRKKIVLH